MVLILDGDSFYRGVVVVVDVAAVVVAVIDAVFAYRSVFIITVPGAQMRTTAKPALQKTYCRY